MDYTKKQNIPGILLFIDFEKAFDSLDRDFMLKCLNVFGFGPRGGTPYNGLYGEAPPERGTFFRLQVYKRVGISEV